MPNDFVLRPRFQLKLKSTKKSALTSFEVLEQTPFIIKISDDHIFIKFHQEQLHFWSPQLHLEIIEEPNGCIVHGLFGPNPTLWTFFMFIHFGIATIFIILGVWAYSSASLYRPYGLQVALMIAMVVLWFVLYFYGRYGKKKGYPQMLAQYEFMKKVLDIQEI